MASSLLHVALRRQSAEPVFGIPGRQCLGTHFFHQLVYAQAPAASQ